MINAAVARARTTIRIMLLDAGYEQAVEGGCAVKTEMSAEGLVLHAALDDDWEQAAGLLDKFHDTEMRDLQRACNGLSSMIAVMLRLPKKEEL